MGWRARRIRLAAALLVVTAALAACGSGNPSAGDTGRVGSTSSSTTSSSSTTTTLAPTTTTVPPLAHGLQGSDAAIPWAAVGSGWTLATWQSVATPTASGDASLFLVDPAGGRYLVSAALPADQQVVAWGTTSRVALLANWFVPSGGADLTGVDLATGATLYQTHLDGVGFQLAATSGDGQRALVTSEILDTSNVAVTELDLSTGATANHFTVAGPGEVSYTEPQGLALIVDSAGQLRRTSLGGTSQLVFPTSFSTVGTFGPPVGGYRPFLYSADGTEVVLGASRGLAVVLNSGAVEQQIPLSTSGSSSGCEPVQWWTGGAVLAACSAAQGGAFWVVPLSGGAPTMLAQVGPVFGNLYQAGGGVFAQSGACGTEWVDQLGSNQTFAQVDIPGLQPSEIIIGSTAGALEILGRGACDESPGQVRTFALVSFDPSTDTSSFQLGPEANGGSVLSAVGYPAGPVS